MQDRLIGLLREGFMKPYKPHYRKNVYKEFAWCEKCQDRHEGTANETRRGPEIIKCDKKKGESK